MSMTPDPRSNFGPQRAGEQPEPLQPLEHNALTPQPSNATEALALFESLLLIAASATEGDDLSRHPLVLVQAAKAMIGLRPDEPSHAVTHLALETCRDVHWSAPDIAALAADPEQLGLTVSVHDFEDALAAGNGQAAQAQLARLLMVSDSRQFLFDILLDQAARDPHRAPALLPFVHSCQRAHDFIGPLNFAAFILPAIRAVAAQPISAPVEVDAVTSWEVLGKLAAGPAELLSLAAHAAQIEADEHIKGPALANRLGRTLAALAEELPDTIPFDKLKMTHAVEGTAGDLLAAALAGEIGQCRGIGRHLAATGERVWLLEVLESTDKITPQLLLWADAIRMLLRVAPEEERGLVGDVAGAQLANLLSNPDNG